MAGTTLFRSHLRSAEPVLAYSPAINSQRTTPLMPSRAKRPCSRSGCPALVDKGFCDAHQQDAPKKMYDRWRGSAASRGSSDGWPKAREIRLKTDYYLCQMCLRAGRVTPATMVDHIIPIAIDPSRRLDQTNLQSLCDSSPHNCHAVKTADDKRKYGVLVPLSTTSR